MYAKKFVFSATTIPMLVFMHQAAGFQQRRRQDKEGEVARRTKALAADPVDITPKNGGDFPWTGQDEAKFGNDWNCKPVELNGYLDMSKQLFINKYKNGEKGVEVVAPFYTHLDKSEKPCGILVSRGWMPWDLKEAKMDNLVNISKVQGVLYRGDNRHQNIKRNVPIDS